MRSPGFLNELQRQLESIPLDVLERVNRHGGLQVAEMLEEILRPTDHCVHVPYPVDDDSVVRYGDISEADARRGTDAFNRNEVAYCVLAGGAGTRAGSTKALLKIPGPDVSLLGMKTMQSFGVHDYWVMTSPSNDQEIRDHFKTLTRFSDAKVFTQYESFCLTPDNQLAYEDDRPVLRPCGHGDLIPALRHSGVLDDFLRRGGKYVYVVNVDNVLGSPDPAVLGKHISGGKPVTCEVVRREQTDTGGILCNYNGFDQIVEGFRMTHPALPEQFPHFSTNSYVFNADLDFDTLKPAWHRVKKATNNRLLVQYERLLQDLTATFQTQYVEVPRETRFLPVKTPHDLQAAARIFGDKET